MCGLGKGLFRVFKRSDSMFQNSSYAEGFAGTQCKSSVCGKDCLEYNSLCLLIKGMKKPWFWYEQHDPYRRPMRCLFEKVCQQAHACVFAS